MATSKSVPKTPSKTTQVIVGMKFANGDIVPVGVLLVERNISGDRDKSIGRFRYAPSYLKRADAVALDPIKLPLNGNEFRFADFGGLPGALRDCAPDNWGRSLIRRYYLARGIDAPLAEVDYLLASPMDRAGNLHFAVNFGHDSVPIWDERSLTPGAIPEVQELKQYVVNVVKDPHGTVNTPFPAGMDSLLTGSGGSRPKINVTSRDGVYLAKLAYPDRDVASNARLEEASLNMARRVGINTSQASARHAQGSDFLLVKRFDRKDGRPLQMVSAMTVLGVNDDTFNAENRKNWSYPLLAVQLDRWSSDPKTDKEQLFRCMVLHAMLSDADDHPRNYALIRDPADFEGKTNAGGSTLGQWRLSPMYDVVTGQGLGKQEHSLAMNIGTAGETISEENILSQHEAFGLTYERAYEIMRFIEKSVLEQFPQVLDESRVNERDKALALNGIAPLNARRAYSPVQDLIAQMDAKRAAQQAESAPARPRKPG